MAILSCLWASDILSWCPSIVTFEILLQKIILRDYLFHSLNPHVVSSLYWIVLDVPLSHRRRQPTQQRIHTPTQFVFFSCLGFKYYLNKTKQIASRTIYMCTRFATNIFGCTHIGSNMVTNLLILIKVSTGFIACGILIWSPT